jgi:hypothetical protein
LLAREIGASGYLVELRQQIPHGKRSEQALRDCGSGWTVRF